MKKVHIHNGNSNARNTSLTIDGGMTREENIKAVEGIILEHQDLCGVVDYKDLATAIVDALEFDNSQRFLLDNNCGDLILNDSHDRKPEDRIYASDIMKEYVDSLRVNPNRGER